MFTNQGTVIHFNNPKVQASLAANTFTITGHAENKQLTEMLPGILNQLGADSLTSLRRLAETLPKPGKEDLIVLRPFILEAFLVIFVDIQSTSQQQSINQMRNVLYCFQRPGTRASNAIRSVFFSWQDKLVYSDCFLRFFYLSFLLWSLGPCLVN